MQAMKKWWGDILAALERGRQFVTHDVWRIGLPGEQVPHGLIIKNVRVAILLLRGLTEETLLLRASALAFATMLFIVPFLAFMFAFIQTFNLGDQVYSRLSEQLNERLTHFAELVRAQDLPYIDLGAPEATTSTETAPGLSPEATEISEHAAATTPPPQEPTTAPAPAPTPPEVNNDRLWADLIETMFPGWKELHADDNGEFADPVQILVRVAEHGATNPRALSIAGILYVLTTVLGLMRNVEWTFNRIWGVRQPRGIWRTISDYLIITLLLPFVAAGVLGISAALATNRDTPELISIGLRIAQVGVICLTFSLLYYVVPNTRVQFRNALLGGIVAGSAWTGISWAYITFQVGLARYALFFSTFALFPLMLMWIYLSWLTLLFGALLSFAYQNEKTFAMERLADTASFAYREALGVRLLIELTRRFRLGRPALAVAEAAEAWNVPTRLLNETLEDLMGAGMVTACATDPVTYQPGRAPETTRVIDVVQALRNRGDDPSLLRHEAAHRDLYRALDDADPALLTQSISALEAGLAPDTGTIALFTPRGPAQERPRRP